MQREPNSATLTHAPSQTALHGIYFKMCALVLFCTMDAMVKGLGGTYGSFQLMVFRSAVALLPVAVLRPSRKFARQKWSRPKMIAVVAS